MQIEDLAANALDIFPLTLVGAYPTN